MPDHGFNPWFNGPYVGAGLCLPKVWQGWMVLGAGLVTAVLGSVVWDELVSMDWFA